MKNATTKNISILSKRFSCIAFHGWDIEENKLFQNQYLNWLYQCVGEPGFRKIIANFFEWELFSLDVISRT